MDCLLWTLCFSAVFLSQYVLAEQCPPLPISEFRNGKIIRISITNVRFVCDEGYFLSGPEQLYCTKGEWSKQFVPECLMAEDRCDPPIDVENADRFGADTRIGSTVKYICLPGYYMRGNDTRTCLRTLYWSGLTPVCHSEKESLANIATRLESQFIDKMGAFSNTTNILRILDNKSLKVGLELVILLDSSSSIDPADFSLGINFIKFLLTEFGVKNGNNAAGTRVALLTFGNVENIVFNLVDTNVDGIEVAKALLDKIEQGGGGTAMQPALSAVVDKVVPVMRQGTKKALFLITDGVPNIGERKIEPEDVARLLKNKEDMEIFTVGIGVGTDKARLTKIASEPSINHVFMLDKYSDFNDIIWLIKNKATPAPPPGPDKCGFIPSSSGSNKRRKKQQKNKAPWLAAIYTKISDGADISEPLSFCTGALICSSWVITAAKCFYVKTKNGVWIRNTDDVYVTLGEYHIAKTDVSQMNFYGVHVVIHEEYDPETSENNLAVIRLNAPVPLNLKYRPICLPDINRVIPLWNDVKTSPIIFGWGTRESNLRAGINPATVGLVRASVELPISGETDCKENLGRMNVGNHVFCVGYGSPVNGSCYGDEGSPITAMDPDTSIHHLLGVMNNRRWCATKYSVFTLVRDYIEWINLVTNYCHEVHLP